MAAIGNMVGLGHRAPAASRHGSEPGVRCEWGAARYTGTASARSEDAWRADPEVGVFAFAEGLGGFNAGDVASAAAVHRLGEGIVRCPGPASAGLRRRVLTRQIVAANTAIRSLASRQPQSLGMASSLSCLWVGGEDIVIGHVGHSEIWLARDGGWRALNRPRRDGAMPSRLLGVEPDIEIECSALGWQVGDRLLLCSGGTGGRIGPARLASILHDAVDAAHAASGVIDAASAAASLDNVAALVVFVTSTGTGSAPLSAPGSDPLSAPLSAPDRAV